MRTLGMIAAAACVGLSYGQGVRLPNHDGGVAADQDYANAFSARNQITITGTVTGKVKGSPGLGYAEGVDILVRNAKGHVYSVDLGPSWYVADQIASIQMGDRVRVTGSPVTFGNGEKVLLARQVKKGSQLLTLRDTAGWPYWMAFHKGRYQIEGTNNSALTGRIVSSNPVNAEGQQEMGYQIQTANGIQNVAVAPAWYLQNQPLPYQVGDNITIAGTGAMQFGNVIVAGGIYDPVIGTTVLRPNGVPVWGGWRTPGAVIVP
jgi:hypothetical protein